MRVSFDLRENLRRASRLAASLTAGEKFTFLVGSAASLAPPSCMPSAGELKAGVINRMADKLSPGLRAMIFSLGGELKDVWQELAVEVLFQQMRRELADLALEPLDVFRTQPTDSRFNLVHLALAALADRFAVALVTTNWDLLLRAGGDTSGPPLRSHRFRVNPCRFTGRG